MVDEEGGTALYCRNRRCGVEKHFIKKGYTKLRMKQLSLYNCYISPNLSLDNYKEYVESLLDDIQREDKDIRILGDFNSKSAL